MIALPFSTRWLKGAFNIPAIVQSRANQHRIDAAPSGPFSDTKFFSESFYYAAVPRVSALLHRIRPAAVPRLVTFIVFNSINRQPRRTDSHVLQKIFKLEPTLTDSDSPTSVISKSRVGFFKASSLHRHPRVMRPCMTHSVCFSRLRGSLLMKTSAGLRMPIGHIGSDNQTPGAAITLTPPTRQNLTVIFDQFRTLIYNRQTMETLAGEV